MKLGPNQKKLVEALRDPQYTQAEGTLRDVLGCMCIEGLMCELSGLGQWAENDSGTYIIGSKRYAGGMPWQVMEYYGAFDRTKFHAQNDMGMSFEQFADDMTSNPETYFRESR